MARLLFNLGAENMDFPGSDAAWKAYFEAERGVTFRTIPPTVCALVGCARPDPGFGWLVSPYRLRYRLPLSPSASSSTRVWGSSEI